MSEKGELNVRHFCLQHATFEVGCEHCYSQELATISKQAGSGEYQTVSASRHEEFTLVFRAHDFMKEQNKKQVAVIFMSYDFHGCEVLSALAVFRAYKETSFQTTFWCMHIPTELDRVYPTFLLSGCVIDEYGRQQTEDSFDIRSVNVGADLLMIKKWVNEGVDHLNVVSTPNVPLMYVNASLTVFD